MRRCRVLLLAALGGCNALTGVSSLETDDELGAADGGSGHPDATMGEDVTVAPPDAGGDPDASSLPDAASDAEADVIDALADNFVACKPGSSGPRYGTSAAGSVWSDDNGILVPDDNLYAHTNGGGEPIVVSGFAFDIPQGARIDGIKVDLRRTAEGVVSDQAVTLPKGNAKNNGAWPLGPYNGPYVATTYGSATDAWGATWSSSEVNAQGFSVTIDIIGNGDGHADSVGVTVYYCQ